jgi:hypothetical protein
MCLGWKARALQAGGWYRFLPAGWQARPSRYGNGGAEWPCMALQPLAPQALARKLSMTP